MGDRTLGVGLWPEVDLLYDQQACAYSGAIVAAPAPRRGDRRGDRRRGELASQLGSTSSASELASDGRTLGALDTAVPAPLAPARRAAVILRVSRATKCSDRNSCRFAFSLRKRVGRRSLLSSCSDSCFR